MDQRMRLETLFRDTTSFLINSDVYIIFASGGGGGNHVVKASVWETYSIKKFHFFRSLPLPRSFQAQVGQIHGDGDEVKFFHYYDDLGNKVVRRSDFMGITMVASAKEDNSGWAIVRRVNGKLLLVGGTSAVWYWDLATMFNFSLEIIYGDSIITLRNNSLAGKTLEQLNRGEADLTLMTALVVDFRAKSLTFLQPFYSTLIYVFFSQPSANSIRNIVTAPFNLWLWVTIISTWVVLILTVKLGQWFHASSTHGADGQKDADFAATIGLWAIAANCQKSWNAVPGSWALKLIFICGSLCGVMVFGAYSAAIVSTLAVHSIPVESFVDLINFKFAFTVHNRSEPFQLILKHLIQLWGLKQEVLRVETEAEISHLLEAQKPKAFLSYQDLFYQTAISLGYSEQFVCNVLSKVQVSDFRYKNAMFLKKGSEYTEILNHKVLVIRERGFNFRYIRHYEHGNLFACATDREKTKDLEPLSFYDAFTAFLVVFIGYVVSLVLLLLERLHVLSTLGASRDQGG
ncbi:uncharacterized protein LOC118434063 [Folsomia candida]|nr:uncharacterized protein LOC118434063 [Folsomia candida]